MERYNHIKNIAWNSFAEQVFVVSFADKKQIHELNPEASFLWRLLTNPISADELSHRLQTEYEVSETEANQHVKDYIKELQDKGLICLAQ